MVAAGADHAARAERHRFRRDAGHCFPAGADVRLHTGSTMRRQQMKIALDIAVAFAAAALALGQGAWAGEAEAKKWIDSEFQPSTLTQGAADGRDEVVHRRGQEAAGQGREGDLGGVRDHHHARVRVEDAGQGLRGDHRHQGQARPDPGRRRGREAADLDAVGQVDLRRLDQRLRPDRHALPLRQDHEPDRLHGGQGQGVHQPRAGHEGLHRHQASRPRPTASSTSCPTSSSPTCTGSAPTCSRART